MLVDPYEQNRLQVVELRNQISSLKVRLDLTEGQKRLVEENLLNRMPAYTGSGFWKRFKSDLRNAQKQILIVCPFMKYDRIANLECVLEEAVERGVHTAILVRPPNEEDKPLHDMLTDIGVVIHTRKAIHQKLIVVDDILWEGSLNALSHFGNRNEHMRRIEQRQILLETMKLHNLVGLLEGKP